MGLFDPKGPGSPANNTYGAHEKVVIDLAKKYGVSPREFQEVAWAGAKKAKEGAKYPGSKPMIQEVNEAIERTARVTGMSPQDVLEKAVIRSEMPLYSTPGTPALGILGKQMQTDPQTREEIY